MLCLVLGGTGFIGTSLVQALVRQGHGVTSLARSQPTGRPLDPNCRYLWGDWRDPAALDEALDGVDCIYHLIGTVDVAGANADPIADLQQTVADSVRLLRLCAGRPNTRVVYVSSGGSVYGVPRTLPIPEDHPTEPLSAHGISKLTVEKYLALFSRLHGLEYQVARCANPYGEWQASAGRQGIVAALLGKLLANEPLTIWGDGRVVRDFVYVRDVAEALVRLGSRTGEPRIFNVGSGTGTSLNRLVALMADVTGREPAVEYSPGRPFDVPESVLDISRIREHCGWQPATGLRTGLAQTWRWLSEPGRHVPHPDR